MMPDRLPIHETKLASALNRRIFLRGTPPALPALPPDTDAAGIVAQLERVRAILLHAGLVDSADS